MNQKMNVYIWDMDETLILLKSLIDGKYAEAFVGSKDVQKGMEIGKMWEDHILQVCDEHFYYEQIESCNKPFLDALQDYDDGKDLTGYDLTNDGFVPSDDDINRKKLAYRYRTVASKYRQGLRSLYDEGTTKLWDTLYDATDSYTDRWLSSARMCLEQCSSGSEELAQSRGSTDAVSCSQSPKHVNVLVTSSSLIPSLVKCMLFRFDDLIPYENVYSSWDVGKLNCFSLIRDRFSRSDVRFCVIGDGWEECAAAEAMKWPFVQIDLKPDGPHRFPGLTLRTLGHYFSVVYGDSDEEN